LSEESSYCGSVCGSADDEGQVALALDIFSPDFMEKDRTIESNCQGCSFDISQKLHNADPVQKTQHKLVKCTHVDSSGFNFSAKETKSRIYSK
jgi:hypothetical protein